MSVQSRPAGLFDPLDPEFLADPYPVYARLRAGGPVVRDGATQWVVARHEQVSRLLRDPRLRSEWPESFQRMRIGEGAAKDFLLRVLLHREGANHAVLRKLLNNTLHTTGGPQVRACVAEVTDARITRAFESGGSLEVMADFALPVPVAVACELIGIPPGDRGLVEAWGLEIIKAFTVILPEEDRGSVDIAIEQLREYLSERLRKPAGNQKLAGVFAGMTESAAGHGIGPGELVDNLIFLLVSGFTTTVHVLAAVGAALLTQPRVFAELRQEPGLLNSALEEFLRYDTPIQHISRYAAESIDVDGHTIRPGRVVHLLLGSANRDERRFTDPDVLDIRRDPNPHVSFGAGLHMCLGAGLGRLEAKAVLERVLARCATFEPDGELVRRPVQVFRTYARLPARIGAARP